MRFTIFIFSLFMVEFGHASFLQALKAGMTSVANPAHANGSANNTNNGSSSTQNSSFLGGLKNTLGNTAMGLGRYEVGQEESQVLGGFNPYGYHPWGAGPAMSAGTLYNDSVNAPGAVGTSGGGYNNSGGGYNNNGGSGYNNSNYR